MPFNFIMSTLAIGSIAAIIRPPSLFALVRPLKMDDGQMLPLEIASYSCTSLDGPACTAYHKGPSVRDVSKGLAGAMDLESIIGLEEDELEDIENAMHTLFKLSLHDLIRSSSFERLEREVTVNENEIDNDEDEGSEDVN